jgi:uncharacterized protein
MKRIVAACLLAGAPLLAAPAPLAAQSVIAPQGVAVRENGLVATWFAPATGKRGPVLLVLGGSEGGEDTGKRVGAAFAAQGYGVLALAYFKAEGLPEQLQEIPLEYFARALRWIEAQPLADARRIGVYGVSKGGETALLLASRHPQIKAVVAGVPSSVVWQGINFADYTSVKSSFSLDGKPVPFLPYDMSAPFTGIHDLYLRSLRTLDRHPETIIPVEKIAGPVLLISGKSDTLWPSALMADQVIARLDAKGFKHPHRHLAYADAGHGAAVPPARAGAPASASSWATALGGTEAGNNAAREDSWKQILAFFAQALGSPAK